MTNALPPGLTDCLLWSEEHGMGYHPRPPMDYSGPYFAKYQALDATPMGQALTAARVAMVRRHHQGEVVDIGIGGGRFVLEADARGFDVNGEAQSWLVKHDRWQDPYTAHAAALTFWDSLEHIPDPEQIVASAEQWVFVSMPIYQDSRHCLKSKHFKPGEHLWFFTDWGLIGWMDRQGFDMIERNDIESTLGREEILSYAFRRR